MKNKNSQQKTKIRVTQDFINIGEREDPQECPTYYALKAALNSPTQSIGPVYQGGKTHLCREVPGQDDWEVINFTLPKVAREFIRRFDAGKRVKPFSFEIALP